MTNRQQDRKVIGVIPAAGQAIRVAPLPCSKELYPVGFRAVEQGRSWRPKAVCHYLLESMRRAGIAQAYIVLRPGKWDIPAYLGDGALVDMHLAYLMMGLPFGAPYTVDQAYPFVQDALVALGFPDIIFQPEDAFVPLLERQAATDADIVLGLFPPEHPQKWDMVDLDHDGRVRQIVIKPSQTHLRYAWLIAVWTPVFTGFMHQYLAALQEVGAGGDEGDHASAQRELFVGDVVQAALQQGLRVEAVTFPAGACRDIGTPEELAKTIRDNLPPVLPLEEAP